MAGAAVAAAARRSGILRRPPSALFTKTSKPWPSSCASLPLVSSASDSFSFSFSLTASEVGPPSEPASSFQRWQGFRDVPNAQRFGTGSPAVHVTSSASRNLESFSDELKKAQAQFGRGFPCGGQATVARSLQKQEDILHNPTAFYSGGQIVRQPTFGSWPGGVPAWQDCLIRRLFSRQLKTLKVVLSEEVEGLGRAGQVVSVAPGYARNKLIPHHLALPALPKYVSLVNNQLKMARPHLLIDKEEVASRTSSEEEQLEEIETALKRLDVSKVVFRRHVSSLNNLRHAVTKEDIVFEVKRQTGVQLAVSNVILPADLNLLGEYEVQLRFPNDVRFPKGKDKLYLNVRIRRK